MNLEELRAKRKEKNDKLRGLIEVPDGQTERKLSEDEFKEFESLEAEVKALDEEIRKAENIEAARRKLAEEAARNVPPVVEAGEEGEGKELRSILKKYSISRAIRAAMPGQNLDGLEREMHEEAQKECQRSGRSVEGIGVPGILLDMSGRGLNVGTAAEGGYTVAEDMGDLIPVLSPKTLAMDLGVTILDNMTSNFSLPKQTSYVNAAWEGETDENAESNAGFDEVKFSPKRLGATSTMSKQLLLQSSIGVDALVRAELEKSIGRALDIALFNGSGANDLNGILGLATAYAMGNPDGGAMTRDKLIDMISNIHVSNADVGDMSWVGSVLGFAAAQKIKVDAGSGKFLMENHESNLIGYKTHSSNLVPTTLTKGASVGICHALLFGVWSEYVLANWGGLDLVVDPYAKKKNAQVEVTANTWWAGDAKHDEAFVAAADLLVS